jgi:hypothetical protein
MAGVVTMYTIIANIVRNSSAFNAELMLSSAGNAFTANCCVAFHSGSLRHTSTFRA